MLVAGSVPLHMSAPLPTRPECGARGASQWCPLVFQIVSVFLGLSLLYVGGEALVAGATSLANRLRVPPFLIGLTIVGFGTSMPELVVSLDAALGGATDLALGNVVGSNTANILLILGLAALIAPIRLDTAIDIRRDLSVMLVASLALGVLGLLGSLSAAHGALLVVALFAYLAWAGLSDKRKAVDQPPVAPSLTRVMELAAIGVGLALLVAGGHVLVEASVVLARGFGVSEAVIGLTLVAVGTSLPELATSVIAALRGRSAIAAGNVIGSNIFNIAGILGVTAMVHPLQIPARFAWVDIPAMIVVSLVASALLLARRGVSRIWALVFLFAYAGYMTLMT